MPVMTSPLTVDAPQQALTRCHVCGAKLVVRSAADVVIRNAILKIDGGSGLVTAKCSRCKSWVAVPLRYTG